MSTELATARHDAEHRPSETRERDRTGRRSDMAGTGLERPQRLIAREPDSTCRTRGESDSGPAGLAEAAETAKGLRSAYEALLESLSSAVVRLSAAEARRDALSSQLAQTTDLLGATEGLLRTAEYERQVLTERFEAVCRERQILTEQLEAVSRERQALIERLEALYLSYSWRLSLPIRIAGKILRRLRATVRP